jgi:hypothetical protein
MALQSHFRKGCICRGGQRRVQPPEIETSGGIDHFDEHRKRRIADQILAG